MASSVKLLVGVSYCAIAANAWTYNDVTTWATDTPNCASTVTNQSPINIDVESAGTTTNPLTFQGSPDSAINEAIKAELVINNHTWEVEWDVEDAAVNKYGVFYNNNVYRLNQFHFHSPSEHTVNGLHYDLEAHMVHSCYGVECATIDPGDENLVVAIFMNVGEENVENPFLASFWPSLNALAGNASQPHIVDNMANPYNLLVPESHDFIRYMGSTTTPSCVQNVQWFLMSNAVSISQAQLTQYRTAISNHPNTQTVESSAIPDGVTAGWSVLLGTNNRPLQIIGDRLPEVFTEPVEIAEADTAFLWEGVIILAAVVALASLCIVGYFLATKPAEVKKRAVTKPKPKPKPAEEVPLVAPPAPLLQVPHPPMFTQMQVPMTYAAPISYAAPMQVQQGYPQMQQGYPAMVQP